MTPEVLSFDAGGTFLFPHPSVGDVYARAFAAHGIQLDPLVLDRAFPSAFKHALARNTAELPLFSPAFWRAVVFEVLGDLPLDPATREAAFQAAYHAFAQPDAWRVAADFPETLAALKKAGFRLVVFSNNDSRLRDLLRGHHLYDCFEAVFISAEIGLHKPDPRAFRHVSDALAVKPSDLLHIGDSLSRDIHPARQAGWRARLAPGAAQPGDPEPPLPDWITLLHNPV